MEKPDEERTLPVNGGDGARVQYRGILAVKKLSGKERDAVRNKKITYGALLWILLLGGAKLWFRAHTGDRAAMNVLAARVADPVKAALGRASYLVPFSLMELVIALVVLGGAVWMTLTVRHFIRKKEMRRETAIGFLLTVLCIAAAASVAADYIWGVYYYADNLQERSGIYAEEVSVEELERVTRYAAAKLAEASAVVPRDESGLFSASKEEILSLGASAYDNISREIPCLAYADRPPKPVFFSRVMSHLRLTGVYFSFTGEANVNMASPACLLPSTVAHELAHQRGIASEKECNFAAILASTTADSPLYRYSGWLLAYIHLGNALYAADRDRWQEVRSTLPEEVLLDLADNNAYWKPFRENGISEGYQSLYDGYLKNYGESEGVKSYGMVVDLLTVYYRQEAAAYAVGA